MRQIPIFPELVSLLDEAYPAADAGEVYVITRYRDAGTNLRTGLQRIICHAGLKQWPKLFQNLRATRETELAEEFSMHVVCAWIDNSRAVAMKHYLQVTDDHYAKAAKPTAAEDESEALQKALQHDAKPAGTGPQPESPIGVSPEECGDVLTGTGLPVGDDGLEPPTSTV